MRVKLLKDIFYNDVLYKEGSIGNARLNKVEFTDWEEAMVECKFEDVPPLYLSWKCLEKLDKGFWRDRERDVKQAYKIENIWGPRGGFKYLRIYSIGRDKRNRIFTTDVKHEALKILEMLECSGKRVQKGIIEF